MVQIQVPVYLYILTTFLQVDTMPKKKKPLRTKKVK